MHICHNKSKPTVIVKAPNQAIELQKDVKRTRCRVALQRWSLVMRKENF
jgi:hypothetical protein